MKIAVIGNYGATNSGDDAILNGILSEVRADNPSHQITVFSSDPALTAQLFEVLTAPLFPLGFRSFFKYGFRNSIKALKKADVVILGGGGLFQDNYLYACFLWAWQVFWGRFFGKPLFIHSAGVGPLNTRMGSWLTKWAFEQAEVITVRDEFSADLLKKIGVKKEIHPTADPVFLHPYKNISPENKRQKGLFIISLRPWLHHTQEIIQTFLSFLKYLKGSRGAEFIFVSMQQIREHDLQMVEPLVRELGGKVYSPPHFSDLLSLMQTAECAIGMRYHFMIAALLTQTPLLPISYSPKTEALFQGSELKEYLSFAHSVSESRLKTDFEKFSNHYDHVMAYEKILVDLHAQRATAGSALLKEFLKKFDLSKA